MKHSTEFPRASSCCTSENGHAPGALREEFQALIEPPRQVDDLARLLHVTGLLWNCTDILPAHACNDLGLAPGHTYAQVARALRTHLRQAHGLGDTKVPMVQPPNGAGSAGRE